MTRKDYFKKTAKIDELNKRIDELTEQLQDVNIKYRYEPLTYFEFYHAVEFWYDATNHSRGYAKRAWKYLAVSVWSDRYKEYQETGTCTHLYSKYVLGGMSFEEAFILDNNEDGYYAVGGQTFQTGKITEIRYDNNKR